MVIADHLQEYRLDPLLLQKHQQLLHQFPAQAFAAPGRAQGKGRQASGTPRRATIAIAAGSSPASQTRESIRLIPRR
jgi:hypothetical protein